MRLLVKAALLLGLIGPSPAWAPPNLYTATQDFAAAYNTWIATVQTDASQGLDAAELHAWQRTEAAWKTLRNATHERY
jgi:hypothetical protein